MLRAGNVMEDATQTIQKEKREEALKVGEASGQLYNNLLNYISLMSKQLTLQRLVLQIKIQQESSNQTALTSKSSQTLVRLLDKALRAQKVVTGLERDSKDT